MNFLDPRLPDRFWSKCIPEPNSGCWLWLATGQPSGYGSIRYGTRRTGRMINAHRLAYLTLVGPVPRGLELDHLCQTPECCNPAHLEPVTHAENVARGRSPAATRRRADAQTHCKRGHELSGSNLYINPEGSRQCRSCMRMRQKDIRSRRRLRRIQLSQCQRCPLPAVNGTQGCDLHLEAAREKARRKAAIDRTRSKP